jgi:hypothetical protein
MVLELVAEDARRTPEGFPEPKVETNEDGWFNDDKSEGANSYMSLCAQSYNSFEGDETIEIDANQPQYKPQFVDKTLSYANATKGNNSEQISDVTSPEISEVLELKAKVKALEDLVKQLTGEKQKTDKLEDKPKNGASETSVPTIITVENEISKRMLDIETRMESSIQKAMMEMMETLRVEREENKFTNESDEDRDSETMQKQQSGSVGQSDNKKRDRKTTPQKAGTAGRGGGMRDRGKPLTLDNGDGSRFVVGYENEFVELDKRRTAMEIDDSGDSDGSGPGRVQRSIFDDMDPGDKDGFLTQENGAEQKRPTGREAKLKNV